MVLVSFGFMAGKKMVRILAGIVVVLLAGFVGVANAQTGRQLFALPITGQMSNGVAAFGQAEGYNDGIGQFWVQVPHGMRCSGTWNIRDRNPTIVLPVVCTNGARGEAVIARQPGFMSGSAIVALTNGTRGQFVFGNMRYEQTFGSGGSARTY